MSQPADQIPAVPEATTDAVEALPRAEVLRRIVITLPATLQERDIEVARLALKAMRDGDELLAHELCELHSHPVHAWRRVQLHDAPPPEITDADRAATARLELERQRFEAMGRNDTAEVKRLSLELGLRPPTEQKEALPPPAAKPTTSTDAGVHIHYRRNRGLVRRAADFLGESLPFGLGNLYRVARSMADGRLRYVPTQSPRRSSPADVFNRGK